MKKKIIILVLAIATILTLTTIKQADAYAYNIPESEFFNNEYEYNIFPNKTNYVDNTSATPITSLNITDLTFYYQLGYLRDAYYEYPPGTIYIMIRELRLEYSVKYRTSSNSTSTVNDNLIWRVPSIGKSNSTLQGDNIIYTNVTYNDVFNGVNDFADFSVFIDAMLPNLTFHLYTSKLNDTTIELRPSILIYLYGLDANYELDFTKQSEYIKNIPFNKSLLGDFKALNFDLTFHRLPLVYWDRLEEETAVRKYINQNPPISPDTSYDNIMTTVFGGFADILSIEVFPNISIGLILGLPLLLGALLIILKFIRG